MAKNYNDLAEIYQDKTVQGNKYDRKSIDMVILIVSPILFYRETFKRRKRTSYQFSVTTIYFDGKA